MYQRFIKRFLDMVLSFFALLLLLPLLLLITILVKIKLGSPVLFKQERPGKGEKIFTMYKFRTMTDQTDANGALLPDNIRLTKFGKWLRSTSLDELPELWNILKGDMSIVGPRPLLVQYLPLYNAHQKRRHEIRPGLSGLAQISGRNTLSWEEKFELDVTYVERITFFVDAEIVFKSIWKAFVKRDGISQENQCTAKPFQGVAEIDDAKLEEYVHV